MSFVNALGRWMRYANEQMRSKLHRGINKNKECKIAIFVTIVKVDEEKKIRFECAKIE